MIKYVKLAAIAVVLGQVALFSACGACHSCDKPAAPMEKMSYDYSK